MSPDSLLHEHEDGRIVLFCGAGISYPAQLPGFRQLAKLMHAELHTTPTALELKALDRQTSGRRWQDPRGHPSQGHRQPRANHSRPGAVCQPALTGFGAVVPFEQFGRDGFGLCAHISGVSPKTGSVDSVLVGLSSLTANRALGCVGFNAKEP
jgi:hypothetical protein